MAVLVREAPTSYHALPSCEVRLPGVPRCCVSTISAQHVIDLRETIDRQLTRQDGAVVINLV